jgi:dTDP-4-dehydrorhamnose reductase
LSTDFIFDGTHGPLTEEEKPNPLSYYAETKLEAENIVMASKLNWAIARTVLVYGIVDNMSRSNIVLWVKQNLEQGKIINVVDDQFRTPTLAEDLADGCILIALKKAEGIFNISGKDFMSILELANKVADYYHLDKSLIKPSKSADIKQPAKRPPRTGFIIDKARKVLGYNPHSFEEGIKLMEEQILNMQKS